MRKIDPVEDIVGLGAKYTVGIIDITAEGMAATIDALVDAIVKRRSLLQCGLDALAAMSAHDEASADVPAPTPIDPALWNAADLLGIAHPTSRADFERFQIDTMLALDLLERDEQTLTGIDLAGVTADEAHAEAGADV